ncbi:nucleotidyl transferase AbiEii/AbiGii toxin family protein [Streptomyces sp. NPDC007863]|uniref:nucleotidyl transferase AbiEii/AbiGii toxin family protein n=1 Tax=Streptomyces sp. NPDC007863 TaxID=3154894 RepID=UPI0033F8D3F7
MKLTGLHRRLLDDVLRAGTEYPLVLTGGYAVQAHGLVDRLSQDLDVATENPRPMAEIVAHLRSELEARGWRVRTVETDPLSARLIVTDAGTGEACEVDVLKEVLCGPPERREFGLLLSLRDVVGTKVRALADRGMARDLIDVHAAAERGWSPEELEELGRQHARDGFDLEELQAKLAGAEWIDDEEFAAHGLDEERIRELRGWAQRWADDIGERLLEGTAPEDDDPL